MTATLTWGGDAMPPAVVMAPAERSSYHAAPARAAEIDARLRAQVGVLTAVAATVVDTLREAREANVHLAVGFDRWHEYVCDVFADLRNLRLDGTAPAITERRAIVGSFLETPRPDGGRYSVTDLIKVTGYSRGLIQGDRRALGFGSSRTADVIELEPEPEPNLYEGMNRTTEALARVAAQSDRGLTSLELDDDTGWPMGTATGRLSDLNRRKLIEQRPVFRRNRSAYVVTDLGRARLAAVMA